MTSNRPGVLSTRAVNQYRRRDVISYLALRYYLHSAVARSDRWASAIPSQLVELQDRPIYYKSHHYKDVNQEGTVEHRSLLLPTANEALAEAALLAQCASHPTGFRNPSGVFSYDLASGNDRRGVFMPYADGLRRRHSEIAAACAECPDGIVQYSDIRRYYPSINPNLALEAWRRQSSRGTLDGANIRLGEKLLSNHDRMRRTTDSAGGILTGPQFSHLIGNLVLRELDLELLATRHVRYFRYVDDIVLVGERTAVLESTSRVKDHLGALGLHLHAEGSSKHLEVSTKEWLRGRADYEDDQRENSWMTFVGDLKRFLLMKPESRNQLQLAFRHSGLRVPIMDYSALVSEVGFKQRFTRWIRGNHRFRNRHLSIARLAQQATRLRDQYVISMNLLLTGLDTVSAYERKRRIPKLRYRASRLVYLGTDEQLAAAADAFAATPELTFYREIMRAVASGKIDTILKLGANAAQAGAQPLGSIGRRVAVSESHAGEIALQCLAIFSLNGLSVDSETGQAMPEGDILRFASEGSDLQMLRGGDDYVRELASLHGVKDGPRHQEMLLRAYDVDESMTFDAIVSSYRSFSN